MKQFFRSFLWLPLFFPFYLLKGEIWGIPTNLLEVVLVFYLLTYAGFYGWQNWLKFWKTKHKLSFFADLWASHRNLIWGGVVLLIIGVLGVLIVPKFTLLIDGQTLYPGQRVALGILKSWLILPYAYFVMLFKVAEKDDDLITSVIAYILSALGLAIWAIAQFVTGQFITLDGRASGPFINANYLAMYLAPALVGAWILVVRAVVAGWSLQKMLLNVGAGILLAFALLITQSYGAILAVIVALICYLVVNTVLAAKYQRKADLLRLKLVYYFLGFLAFLLVLAGVAVFSGTTKWNQLLEIQQRSSSAVRVEVYQIAGEMIKSNPLLGLGLGQFEPVYNLQAPEILGHAPYEWVMLHPHNLFLATWLNLGLLGVLALLALIVMAILRFWRAKSFEIKYFRLLGLSMLLVILLHGMVDTTYFKNDLSLIFWLILAICLIPLHVDSKS